MPDWYFFGTVLIAAAASFGAFALVERRSFGVALVTMLAVLALCFLGTFGFADYMGWR